MAGAIGPHPDMAGLASGLLGFGQLTVAALLGAAVGAAYDGTAVPMMGALAFCAAGIALALATVLRGRRPSVA